jgi:drug/metabolite transporter (DMT)-like permease
VILALLLGALVYHERIDRAGWAGSMLGLVGLILISVVK